MIANPEDIIENQLVTVTINGKKFEGNPTETILDISERNGISIPRLCYMEGMRPDGNCRVCMVEIEGERVLQPSCTRTITNGMIINTSNKRVKHSQKLVLELLAADVSEEVYDKDSELTSWSNQLQIQTHRFPSNIQKKHDLRKKFQISIQET